LDDLVTACAAVIEGAVPDQDIHAHGDGKVRPYRRVGLEIILDPGHALASPVADPDAGRHGGRHSAGRPPGLRDKPPFSAADGHGPQVDVEYLCPTGIAADGTADIAIAEGAARPVHDVCVGSAGCEEEEDSWEARKLHGSFPFGWAQDAGRLPPGPIGSTDSADQGAARGGAGRFGFAAPMLA
jgi:hypothetical protein